MNICTPRGTVSLRITALRYTRLRRTSALQCLTDTVLIEIREEIPFQWIRNLPISIKIHSEIGSQLLQGGYL